MTPFQVCFVEFFDFFFVFWRNNKLKTSILVGAKSAPAGKIEMPDTDSECSDHSESDRSSLSSAGTGMYFL